MDVPKDSGEFPRLAAFLIERPRLLERFAPRCCVLKLVVAPFGYGKTALVSQLAAAHPGRFFYLPLRENDSAREVSARLAGAAASGRTVIVDDAHLPAQEGREALRSFLQNAEQATPPVVCARSGAGVVDARALFDGTVDVIDACDLAFEAAEIRMLCERLAIALDEDSLADFSKRTAGWPLAAGGSLRAAAERSLPIGDAIAVWYRLHAPAVARFVADECARTQLGPAFLRQLQHPRPVAIEELRAWHDAGLFVARCGHEYRIVPVVSGLFGNEPKEAANEGAPLRLALLSDDVRASIGEICVRWERHKDAQLFKYLALKRGEAATRAELMEIFWPGRDRNIAAQNLRTTCSNIRRALRRAVGPQAVGRYFESEGDVRAGTALVTDVEQFEEAMALARVAVTAGDSRSARTCFRKARELYRSDLLTGMPQCGFEELGAKLSRDFGEAVHRLRTLPEFGEPRANAS